MEANQTGDQPPLMSRKLLLRVLWLGAIAYAAVGSPPLYMSRDLTLLATMGYNNALTFALMMANPVAVSLIACLLVPLTALHQSQHTVGYIAASYGLGMFTLMPIFFGSRPPKQEEGPEDGGGALRSSYNWLRQLVEQRWVAAALLLASLWVWLFPLASNSATWMEFVDLFVGSKLVHVTTLDTLAMLALTVFLIYHDATTRRLGHRWMWGAEMLTSFLGFIPLLGPSFYLLIRPRDIRTEAT